MGKQQKPKDNLKFELDANAKKQNVFKAAIAKVIAKINLNSIILAIISLLGTFAALYFNAKQDDAAADLKKSQQWQHKRDSINQITFANQDTIKQEQRMIIKYFKIKTK